MTAADGTTSAVREITTSDGQGNLIYRQDTEYSDGSVVEGEWVALTGQQSGGDIARSLTPFLSEAFIGTDADPFSQIAADTVIGTVLENLGEVLGGTIHRSLVNVGDLDLKTQIDTAFEVSFENFGGELVVNGGSTAISVVNQLIISEIFEFSEGEGVPGAVFDAVVSAGLTEILGNGLDHFLQLESTLDFFRAAGFSEASINTIAGYNFGGLPSSDAGVNGVNSWTSLVFTAIVNEILPDLETLEGQIAQAISTAAFAALQTLNSALGAAAGPFGAVIGYLVGKFFDVLFDKDPHAFTNVGFDEVTGRFVILNTWSDDGGNVQLSQDLAQAYLDGMNGFLDAVQSQSHNFSELGQWSFGHYEDALKNAGALGRTFADFNDTYFNALVDDLVNVQLNDGAQSAVTIFEALDVGQLREDHRLNIFLNTLSENDVLIDSYNVAIPAGQGEFTYEREFVYAVTFRDKVIYFSEDGSDIVVRERTTGENGEPQISVSPFTYVVTGIGENNNRTVYYETEFDIETLLAIEQITQSERLHEFLVQDDFVTYEEFLQAFALPEVTYNDQEIFEKVGSQLQIAHDYQTYLDNKDAIDAMILASPNSAFAAGWVATIQTAKSEGLYRDYDLVGDEVDNLFYTAEGDDIVDGRSGHDYIKTYDGEDIIIGGSGNDTLNGGRGDDELTGGFGPDSAAPVAEEEQLELILSSSGVPSPALSEQKLVDENINSYAMTRWEQSPYFEFAFVATKEVTSIEITNINVSYAGLDKVLNGAVVKLYSSDGTVVHEFAPISGAGKASVHTFDVPAGVLADYARLEHTETRLHISEVKVHGYAATSTPSDEDTFEFQIGDGNDRILDFVNGEDLLRLAMGEGAQFSDLTIEQDGADAVVSYSDSDSIRLVNVNTVDLDQDDFEFV